MAREVIEKLIDDLDGGDASETVTFGLDGATYEIDVSKRNATALRKALERYVKAAREVAPAPTRRRGAPAAARRARPATAKRKTTKPVRDFDIVQLREWAAVNAVTVPSRGRIPQAIVNEYKAAGGR